MARLTIAALALLILPSFGIAQSGGIAFGKVQQDTELPVEVAADNLSVNQENGTAEFTGNVLIGQGEMRLSAPKVLVIYRESDNKIARLKATGGVTLVSGEDAAEAASADYNIDTGIIVMEGNVLLVQGPTALTAQRMRVDTKGGTAKMEGRVKTVLQPKE